MKNIFGRKAIIIALVVLILITALFFYFAKSNPSYIIAMSIAYLIYLVRDLLYYNIIVLYSDRIEFRYFLPFLKRVKVNFNDIEKIDIKINQRRFSSENTTIYIRNAEKKVYIVTMGADDDLKKLQECLIEYRINVELKIIG